jgi:hypothetical protein
MSFAQAFIAQKGDPIEVDGRRLYWTYWLPVRAGDAIHVGFEHFIGHPVQGIGLFTEKAELELEGLTGKKFALWTDTAPKRVALRVVKASKGARVGVYNRWRFGENGLTQYRENDAAIDVVPQDDGSVILRCSDGVGPADFNDLTVRVQLIKDGTGS